MLRVLPYIIPRMEIWTIQKLLSWITGYFTEKSIDSPRLSAELILCHVLKMQRIELYMHFEKRIEQSDLALLRSYVKRASDHEPIAYLVGLTEFYSMEIKVSPDTLIPRPETELLVQRAIDFLRTVENPYVCDLCTGSGCIAIAVGAGVEAAHLIATDICDKALAVASDNVTFHKLTERVKLLCGDLFEPIISGLDETRFDLIVSNPPYVATDEYEQLDKNVKAFEPKLALEAGPDGLDVYKRIIAGAPEHLKPAGRLMMEIGYKQGPAIKELLESSGSFKDITIEKDFAKHDRIVTATLNN